MPGMEKYNIICLIGEGSYGKVIKCRHNDTGQVVAIKKFIETEEDTAARKVALREIRMLKKLHHPHLVCLLEVFRRKKRFHLVFEYIHSSLLEKLEDEGPLPSELTRKYFYQIIKGVDYCHSHNIIHRDIKPENILISDLGIVKLCDFGFARFATVSTEPFTDYVATRWYRAPELLIGDLNYGRGVDIWALGCILIEMLTASPLFTGDSDIDQLYQVTRLVGSLTANQKTLMLKLSEDLVTRDSFEDDMLIEKIRNRTPGDVLFNLQEKYPSLGKTALNLVSSCLRIDPDRRITSEEIMKHPYFTWDRFLPWFLPELQKKVNLEALRKEPVSETSYPQVDASTLAGMVGPRRPSKTKGNWSIDLIHDSPLKECPLFTETRKLKVKQMEPSEVNKEVETASGSVENATAYETYQSKECYEKEDLLNEIKENEMDMPKINMEYRRHMMPDSFLIKPIQGRLHFDKDHFTHQTLQKSSCEEICLPQIRDLNNRFSRTTRNFDLKSGIGTIPSVKVISQEQQLTAESEREDRFRNLTQLKRKKAIIPDLTSSKSQSERKENICICEYERIKTPDNYYLPDV